MPLLNSLYKRELINMALLAYPYEAHLELNTPLGAFTALYLKEIQPIHELHSAVIRELTEGIVKYLGADNLKVIAEL